jgi:hypothetical protein
MQRADELLRQMTIEEKAMQLSSVVPIALLGPEEPMRSQLDSLLGQGIGHIAGIGLLGNKSPEMIAKTVNAIQRYLVTNTCLKIPAIFHNEALNGVVSPGFTAFPTAIVLAATWDPEAVQEMADIMRGRDQMPRLRPSNAVVVGDDGPREAHLAAEKVGQHSARSMDRHAVVLGVGRHHATEPCQPDRGFEGTRVDRVRQTLPWLRRYRSRSEHGRDCHMSARPL